MAEVVNQQIEQVKAGINAQVVKATEAGVTQASQIVDGLASKLKSSALAGADIVGAASNIGQQIFGSVGSLFSEINAATNTVLGNFTQDKQQLITKNFNEIPKALSVFGSGELSSKGLGFIASTKSKAIEGIDLPGAEAINNFAEMGLGQLSRLSTMGSEVLNSNKNAIQAVTGAIQDGIATGANIVNNVTGAVSSTVNQVLEPISELAKPVSTLLNGHSVANIVSSNLSFLPSSLKSYVGNKVGSAASNATANALNSIGKTVGINNLAGATQTVTNILNNYNNKYYNQAGANGEYINGISSYNGDKSNFNTLINLASNLCNSIPGSINTIDYSTNKGLYDMLISLACQLGLGNIAELLLNCFDTGDFYDSRTRQILGDIAGSTARNGDTFSTNLIFKTAKGYVSNPSGVMTTLVANSTYSSTNKTNINNAFTNANISMSDLITDSFFYGNNSSKRNIEVNPPVYDAEIVTVMQATCTDYIDEEITMKDRNLVNGIYALWGSKTGTA